jgi:hypothetical protein
MPAQAEAGIVVFAFVIGLPQVDQRARHGAARPRQNKADELDRLARHAGLDQLGALGRGRLEERPLGLAQCRGVAVMAFGRRIERHLRQRRIESEEAARGQRARREHGAAAEKFGHGKLLAEFSRKIPAKISRPTPRAAPQCSGAIRSDRD